MRFQKIKRTGFETNKNMDYQRITITIIAAFLLVYGIFSYIDLGFSQGNYGLIGIPVGAGVLVGWAIAAIKDKLDAKRGKNE